MISAVTHDPRSEGPLLSLAVNALQSHPKILKNFVFVIMFGKSCPVGQWTINWGLEASYHLTSGVQVSVAHFSAP